MCGELRRALRTSNRSRKVTREWVIETKPNTSSRESNVWFNTILKLGLTKALLEFDMRSLNALSRLAIYFMFVGFDY